jgi:predicted CXXCH cytochrome family protein
MGWTCNRTRRDAEYQVAEMQLPIVRPRYRAAGSSFAFKLAVTLLFLTGVVGLALPGTAQAGPAQPISFNHQVHVKQMTCIFCHRLYESREMAGRPELSRCMLCHAYPVSKSPEADKLRALAAKQEQIPWVRLTRVQPFVRFSHQRHVVVGKVECVSCHGDIAATTVPPRDPLVAINMQLCLDCHTSKTVQLAPGAPQALKAQNLRKRVLDEVLELERKRFHSSQEFLAKITRVAGPLSQAEERMVARQLHPARPVSTDCFACHR